MPDRRGDTDNYAAIIVLAAGPSLRMGVPKQLLRFRGQPLLRHVVTTAIAAGYREVFVVVGAHHVAMKPALADLPVSIVHNPRWADGLGTSIRAGINALSTRVTRVAFILGDQPFVRADFLAGLLTSAATTDRPIIASRYAGTVSLPALFARSTFDRLACLPPEAGCEQVLRELAGQTVVIDCPEGALDIDTQDDYVRLVLMSREASRSTSPL